MRKIFLIFTVMMSASVFGYDDDIHALPDFKKLVDAPGVGILRVVNRYMVEPISNPRKISVEIQCEGTKVFQKFIDFQIYELEDFKYDPKSKVLSLKYVEGRVNAKTGETIHDINEHPQYSLSGVCKK